MNIFAVDENPMYAAQDLADAHVIKMSLESAQILCTVHHLHGKGQDWMYRPTHKHHPSVKWAAEADCNYGWLWYHFRALADEYTYRFGKEHKSWKELGGRLSYPPMGITQTDTQTPFALAMPDEYKFFGKPVECYRAYYAGVKTKLPRFKYSYRPEPKWLDEWQARLA